MKWFTVAVHMLYVATASAMAVIKVGDKIPAATLHFGFPPTFVNTAEYAADKNMIVIGLPGAFTPTVQVPGYLKNQETLKAAGIDEVLIYCVNDGAVMRAWFENQNLGGEGSIISMMGDPEGEFTRACGMELTDPGPRTVGLLGRSKRFGMIVGKNVVKHVAVSEAPDDPAGDNDPSKTCHEAILNAWQEIMTEASA